MPDFTGTVPMVHCRFPANQKLQKGPAWPSLYYFTLQKNITFHIFPKIYDQTSFQEHNTMLPPQFMLALLSLLTAES
jgi:hypothetical protein